MRLVIQRVKRASVLVDTNIVGQIERGLLVLVGICPEDSESDCIKAADKVVKLRLWPDENGTQWQQNVGAIGGRVLCVSQFTLYGNVKKGTKPDFHAAAKGEQAISLYELFKGRVAAGLPKESGTVEDGQFGAMMDVELVNDGPVTIQYDTKA